MSEKLPSSKTNLCNYSAAVSNALHRCQVTNRYEKEISLSDGQHQAMEQLLLVRKSRGIVHCIGNGGSAAIASHLHNDLTKAANFKALVYTETPILTAYANDDGYASAYALQLERWITPGNLLIAISSSGESENILRAVAVAQEANALVMTFSGFSENNTLRRTGDLNFYIPEKHYGMVEMAHSVMCHYFTDMLSEQHPIMTSEHLATIEPPYGE